MADPILLFLIIDAVALLVLGAGVRLMHPAVSSFLTTMLCGLGTLLCLPPLLTRAPATVLDIPIGPPGLSLHFALDPLAIFFLILAFIAGTAVAAFQATAVPLSDVAPVRVTACCIGGAILSVLAADGGALTIGLAVMCAAIDYPGRGNRMVVPMLVLAAVCLLTPGGFAPRFDAIRIAPIDPGHAAATAGLTLVAVAALAWPVRGERCWTRETLTSGMLVPSGVYLLLRLVIDLSGTATQAWWGVVFVLAGGAASVVHGWYSAASPDIDTAVAALVRRQSGLAVACVGLALIARTADLPNAATFALEATSLLAIGGGVAGILASLAAHAIGAGAGTYRLSRLGGLIHSMPVTSAGFSAGLLALSALPPALGFASLWLAFQSIMSAPRAGDLLSQVALALVAAAFALSAALATAAAIRLIGIAILGRPRTPRGAGARESRSPVRSILLTLAGASLLSGVLPRPILWLLADPAILDLTGLPAGRAARFGVLSASGSSSGYLVLPVSALLALAAGVAILVSRRPGKEAKPAGPWSDGMPPPVGLPFGEPTAQSAGAGFLPALPVIRIPRVRPAPRLPRPTAGMGLWLLLGTFAALLLALAVSQ